MTPEKLAVARHMYDSRGHTLAAIGAVVGVSRSTLYRYLGDQGRPELSSLKGREETRTNRVGPRPPTGQLPGRQLPDSRDKARLRDAPVPRDKRQRSALAVATISRSHGPGSAALQMRSAPSRSRR